MGRAVGGTMGLVIAWVVVAQLPAWRLTGATSFTSGSVVPGMIWLI